MRNTVSTVSNLSAEAQLLKQRREERRDDIEKRREELDEAAIDYVERRVLDVNSRTFARTKPAAYSPLERAEAEFIAQKRHLIQVASDAAANVEEEKEEALVLAAKHAWGDLSEEDELAYERITSALSRLTRYPCSDDFLRWRRYALICLRDLMWTTQAKRFHAELAARTLRVLSPPPKPLSLRGALELAYVVDTTAHKDVDLSKRSDFVPKAELREFLVTHKHAASEAEASKCLKRHLGDAIMRRVGKQTNRVYYGFKKRGLD